jgi:hypothetical protein
MGPVSTERRNALERNGTDIDSEIKKIWKALLNLDKADIQTTALCHAIITLMIDNGIVTQEQAAAELGKSIPKVMALRKDISSAIFDPRSILNSQVETKTVQ